MNNAIPCAQMILLEFPRKARGVEALTPVHRREKKRFERLTILLLQQRLSVLTLSYVVFAPVVLLTWRRVPPRQYT
jgi:hypothetical protein